MRSPRTVDEARLAPYIERGAIVDLARRAVAVPTVNPPGHEAALATLFADHCASAGLDARLLEHTAGRASLIARIRGSGERPGLLLTGHLDVVGPGDRPWTHDPFSGTLSNGRIYGRGAADMKGALAAMTIAAASVKAAGVRLRGDLVVAFTAGEEIDSLGAQAIVDDGSLGAIDAIVIGEPSGFDVYIAEKGNLVLELTARGRTAHASMPHLGANAVYAMAEAVSAIEQYRFGLPDHPLLGGASIAVGTIRGGVRPNVIPDGCVVEVDVRTLPGQRHQDVVAEIGDLVRQVGARRPGIELKVTGWFGREAVESPTDGELADLLVGAVADVRGHRPRPGGVMYATDGAVLVPGLGAPMAICGPGEREQAHQTDEWVAVEALEEAAWIYALAALRWLA